MEAVRGMLPGCRCFVADGGGPCMDQATIDLIASCGPLYGPPPASPNDPEPPIYIGETCVGDGSVFRVIEGPNINDSVEADPDSFADLVALGFCIKFERGECNDTFEIVRDGLIWVWSCTPGNFGGPPIVQGTQMIGVGDPCL